MPEIKKAVLLEDTDRSAIIILWENKELTACWIKAPHTYCHTWKPSEGNEKYYYVLQSFLSDVFKMKIKKLI